jgi:hypothetical protein
MRACRALIVAAVTFIFAAPSFGAEETYMAVMLNGVKIGSAFSSRQAQGGRVTHTESMSIKLMRGQTPLDISIAISSEETEDGKPISFEAQQDLGLSRMSTKGVIGADGMLDVVVNSPESTQNRRMPWPKGALLSEGLRLQARRHGLTEGVSYQTKMYDPSTMVAMNMTVTIGAKEQVDLLGRVVQLVKVIAVCGEGPLAGTTTINWCDDNYDILKSRIEMGGMMLDMISCDKTFALSPSQDSDYFDSLLVSSPQPISKQELTSALKYTIRPRNDATLSIINTGNQKVEALADGGMIVTVTPARPPSGQSLPLGGLDKELIEATRPNEYMQSDHEAVADLARQAIAGATDAAQAAMKIEQFVHEYITTKDLSVGYATAAEVVASRQGDCTEHAVLAGAMCRSVGIPARLVAGVAYTPAFASRLEIFVPHMWVQVNINGQWMDIDPALGFDSGHIAIAWSNGEAVSFLSLSRMLGNYRIEQVEAP